MSKNPQLNRAHQKAWYSRTRQDPVRWRAFLEKRRAYKQARRDGQPVRSRPRPVSNPPANEPEQPQAEGITWASFCEAAGLQPEGGHSPNVDKHNQVASRPAIQ